MNKKLVTLLFVAVLMAALVPFSARAEETSTQQTTEQAKQLETQRLEAEKKAKERAREQEKRLIEQREQAQAERDERLKKEKETARELSNKAKTELEQRKGAFLKACQAKREAFGTHLRNVASGLQKYVASLEAITTRIEDFVQAKNLSVDNYDSLLAAVKTQQALLESMRGQAQQAAEDFICTGEKTEVQNGFSSYHDVAKQQLEALKNYKSALKELIKAVKAAAQAAHEAAANQNSGETQQ